jgi:hypothetical protein
MGAGFLMFGLVASGLFFRDRRPVANLRPPFQAQTPAPRTVRDPEGDLQAELALARQQRDIEEALKNRKPEVKQRTPAQPVAIQQPPVTIQQQPIRTIIREEPSKPPISVPPTIIRETPKPPVVPKDPQAEWLTANRLGSYGQIPLQDGEGSQFGGNAIAVDPLLEENILTGRKRSVVQLAAGTKAKGVLATPVAWEAAATSGTNNRVGVDKFIIQLKEPLLAADGSQALPAGARLITQIESYSQAGLVDLSVRAAIVNVNGNQQELRIPPNVIQIAGSGGKPLVAKLERRGRNPLGLSTATVVQGLLGAASGASRELTQDDRVVTSSGDSTIVTSESNRNVTAGAVRGGTDELIDVISAQNQANLTRQARQAPASYWLTKAGTSVDVIVTQTAQIPGIDTSPVITGTPNRISSNQY